MKAKPASPPEDWSHAPSWDHYFADEIKKGGTSHAFGSSLAYLPHALSLGGRVWFAGCGLDPAPAIGATLGCTVVATDLSAVAVRWQESTRGQPPASLVGGWDEFAREVEEARQAQGSSWPREGSLRTMQHDFTTPPGLPPQDLIVNRRAFQGLSEAAMKAASAQFFAALRPGGQIIVDTMNVQGIHRNRLEDALLGAGFYLPGHETERWYRDQLEATGIVYAMILGQPRIPHWGQYPAKTAAADEERDRKILASFSQEYARRQQESIPEIRQRLADPTIRLAHVVYSTG